MEGVRVEPGSAPSDPRRPDAETSPEVVAAREADEQPRVLRRSREGSLFDAKTSDGANAYGEPGPPVSRSSPFYRGFWGTLGVLLAAVLGLAVAEVRSVLELVLVSIFLAVGLNPLVELLIRRGL